MSKIISKKNILKPCPFCNSKAELMVFNEEYGTVTVCCTNEECDITMGKAFFTDEEAIKHWNRRKVDPEIEEKLAAYEKAEREGLLLKMPCKKGNILYVLTPDSPSGIEKTKCESIFFNKKNEIIVIAPSIFDSWGNAKWNFKMSDFGTKVFLTEAKAEEAIAKKKASYKKAIEKFETHEDVEEEDMLLKLPCKIGDTVYFIENNLINHMKAYRFDIRPMQKFICDNTDKRINFKQLGKTAFLTEEEAEEALDKMRGE